LTCDAIARLRHGHESFDADGSTAGRADAEGAVVHSRQCDGHVFEETECVRRQPDRHAELDLAVGVFALTLTTSCSRGSEDLNVVDKLRCPLQEEPVLVLEHLAQVGEEHVGNRGFVRWVAWLIGSSCHGVVLLDALMGSRGSMRPLNQLLLVSALFR
jgi:hypothetical protein